MLIFLSLCLASFLPLICSVCLPPLRPTPLRVCSDVINGNDTQTSNLHANGSATVSQTLIKTKIFFSELGTRHVVKVASGVLSCDMRR